ncbi:hypothetical protein DXG01_012736 [Tephrocybe rancida]|nr:hypothetical protein DXG01_012736 [Tephrocybe rancida]
MVYRTVLKTCCSHPPTLFALIIGISRYKHPEVPDLPGAVKDVNAVVTFLSSDLDVSEDRIVILRDKQATRKAVLEALRRLAQDDTINTQDPILVYYAGHGGEAPPPKDWVASSPNGMIQMLVPYDFSFEGSKDHKGQGIFDITLSRILNDIAIKKSDNIASPFLNIVGT